MKKIVSLLLVFTMLFALPLLTSCSNYDKETEIRVLALSGSTGVGMAQLIDNVANGNAALNYKIEIKTDPTKVTSALINGDVDIAAMPTNAAVTLSKKTELVMLALNTRGVLYLVSNSNTVSTPRSLSELAGKTVLCPANNPHDIVKALLSKAGVADVSFKTLADPTEVQANVIKGEFDYAILPEPALTAARAKAPHASVAFNITDEWNKLFPADSLVQGCVVARKDFVDAHPNEVDKFLEEYEESINYVKGNPAEAAAMVVAAGMIGAAPIAEKAIPNCNLCFVTGEAMKDDMNAFLTALGVALPADSFYYGVE